MARPSRLIFSVSSGRGVGSLWKLTNPQFDLGMRENKPSSPIVRIGAAANHYISRLARNGVGVDSLP